MYYCFVHDFFLLFIVYTFKLFIIIYWIVWFILVKNNPKKHITITKEFDYLLTQIGTICCGIISC